MDPVGIVFYSILSGDAGREHLLQPLLYQTTYGKYLKENIYFPQKKSWVRHDEHDHVDFKVPCKPL
ncbi:MAG: hypothetical protein CR997_09070 [Acidobacteria bacterium]|nr:MAG: hypothetical protein CR997_09070 [Acidobacteriota bacterium]